MMLIPDFISLDSLFDSKRSPVVGNIYRRRSQGFR